MSALLFCFLGENMRWNANSLAARMLHLLHQFVPDMDSVMLFLPTPSNTSYSLSGIGRFDKSLLCPHEDGQEQRFSSASMKFLWLRQIHDPSGISPALENALSTLVSCCSQHSSCPRSRFLFIHLLSVVTSVTTTVNKSQQRQACACRLF